ncbi:hypothetical protein CLV70_15710 [Pseudosporangium ferrugineum]|uniref:Flavin reductase n=1 Tax=Pseudosporangium ferrugineum TaxID=439699 RepID=A0A2T0R789_9ACTN|nr:hypothetical protein CLV70_15710 [Pseudosporangium ferrugineum]
MTTIYWDAEHEARRPSWDCVKCGRPWPCDPAREHMKAYLGWVALRIYMWGRLDEATHDLRTVPVRELLARVIHGDHQLVGPTGV